MRRNWVYWLLALVVVIAVVVGASEVAFNAGVMQGVAQGGGVPGIVPGGGTPYYYWHGGPFFAPFGFGFILFPLLFFVLIVLAVRGLFWRGPRAAHWGGGVPPRFEEWHRRAHDSGNPVNPES